MPRAHPGKVEDAEGQQDQEQRQLDVVVAARRDVGLDDLGEREEPAEQVARRE